MQAFSVDDRAAQYLLGFLETFSKDLGRSKHMYPVMNYVFERMDDDFTNYMSVTAPNQPDRFHHVYEWNMIGVPKAKLWDSALMGSGTSRFVTFRWRASRTQVPLPNPLPPAGKQGQQLRGGHVFVWKAPMMEYSMPVRIQPILADNLAFMADEIGRKAHRNELWFSRGPVTFAAPPNSRLAAGQFTAAFLRWWGGDGADYSFNRGIKKTLEEGIGDEKVTAALKTARLNVSSGIVTNAMRRSAIQKGKASAKRFLKERDAFYGHGAQARREFVENWGGR